MVGVAQLVEYQIVALVVIGSSPIIYPMWFNFLKLHSKGNFFLKNLKKRNNNLNVDLFDDKKITFLLNEFISLKILTSLETVNKIKPILNYYLNLKKLLKKNDSNNFKTILQLKLTKKQLFSSIRYNTKLIKMYSNGMFLKQLNLTKKSKKKDNKVSIVNLKKTIEVFIKMKKTNLVVNMVGSKTFLLKYIKFLKNNLKNNEIIFVFTPIINYSFNKFKKIKSIKRKLKKKYSYSL